MQDKKIYRILKRENDNYIFPFLWLCGENESVLRRYMKAIDESNMKAVCIESRPHPDFCGSGWWHDMDIIIDEAKKRNMKIWILDDSHFPTGYANGAMSGKSDTLCRQSICCRKYECLGGTRLYISANDIKHPDAFVPNEIEVYIGEKNPRQFDDDQILGL